MTQAMNCQLSITDSEWPNLSAATLCESEVDVSVAMFASLLKGKVIWKDCWIDAVYLKSNQPPQVMAFQPCHHPLSVRWVSHKIAQAAEEVEARPVKLVSRFPLEFYSFWPASALASGIAALTAWFSNDPLLEFQKRLWFLLRNLLKALNVEQHGALNQTVQAWVWF